MSHCHDNAVTSAKDTVAFVCMMSTSATGHSATKLEWEIHILQSQPCFDKLLFPQTEEGGN